MMVVIDHSSLQIAMRQHGITLNILGSGVDIFFVISGFVIYLTGKKLDANEFLKRRVVRVVPLYWLMLIIKVIFLLHAGGIAQLGTPSYLLSSFLFIPAYRANGAPVPPITAAWSLNYEIYFYLGFALLLAFKRERLLIGSTLWISLATIIGLWAWQGVSGHGPAIAMLLAPICLEFLAGMWLAEAWMRKVSIPMWSSILLAGIAVVWLCVAPEPGLFGQSRIFTWGIPAVILMAALINSERRIDYGRWRPALLLGDASYSIYLSHTAVLPFADKLVARLHLPWFAAVLAEALSAMVIGIAIHLLVERRLTSGLTKLLQSRSTPVPKSA